MHFRHGRFQPMQLQHLSLRFIDELSGSGVGTVARILRVGYRGRALGLASLLLRARQRSARQARILLSEVEQAIAAGGGAGSCPSWSFKLSASSFKGSRQPLLQTRYRTGRSAIAPYAGQKPGV